MVIHDKVITDKRRQLKESEIVGKVNGCLEVISLDDIEFYEYPQKHRIYIITVKCKNCGHTFQCTWNNFRSTARKNSKTCRYCIGKQISDNRTKETGLN